MAKYIKQEMPDLQRTGEQKVYYRIKTTRNIGLREFTKSFCRRNQGINEGEVIRILMGITDHLAKLLGEGCSVTIDGIGNFKATIGTEEKEKKKVKQDDNDMNCYSNKLRLTGIKYRTDKELIKKAQKHCKLEHEGEARIRRSPYTLKERLQKALDYLNENGAMRVADYMELTNLSRTTASLELQAFRQDPTSGINYIGKGSAKVYIKKKD